MSLPPALSATLDRIVAAIEADHRFDGVAVGGSVLGGGADEYSDLDLVVVVSDAHYREVMSARTDIAAGWGRLLAAFTGEHVGEPRLLICLFDEPLVHVDLKFVTVEGLDGRIEDPRVLWEREDIVTRRLAETVSAPLTVDPQWIEDRFWIWVHYAAAKLGRGELFEAIDFLSFLRGVALVPLASYLRGYEPRGVRHAESLLPDLTSDLAATVATYSFDACVSALRSTIDVYRRLRDRLPGSLRRDAEAETASVRYLDAVAPRGGATARGGQLD